MSTSHNRCRAAEESVQAVDFRAGQNFGETQLAKQDILRVIEALPDRALSRLMKS
jgi:hypothetical protein